jgi:uncharacterized membrane protein required for colicin V production
MILSALLLLVFVACIGFLYNEGLWSNAVRLVNVVTAALLAMNYFEPLASWLTGLKPPYTVLTDFLAMWALFVLFMVIFRTLTDLASRVKVRFLKMVDRIGGVVFAAWIGWVMVCFTLTTLHTAPLAKNFLFGGFQPKEAMFLGMMAPDQQWLGFTQKMSRGSFCRSAPEGEADKYVFNRPFVEDYENRRAELEAYTKKTGRYLIDPNVFRAGATVVAPPPPE